MNHVFLLLLVPIMLGSMLPHPPSDEWICYRGSLERMGSSDAPAPDTCYLLWKIDTGSELWASPVVKDGRVYQVALEKLYCIDLDTGTVIWTSDVPVYQSTPFLTDDKIIVATNRGISALSIEDGSLIWEYVVSGRFRPDYPLEDYIVSSPAVSDGKVVVGTLPYYYEWVDPPIDVPDEEHIMCLDETTGKELWYIDPCQGLLTSPCVADGKIFVALLEMLCIDLKKGKIVWNSEEKYPLDFKKPVKERYDFDSSTPALYHGILIAGSSNLVMAKTGHRYIQWQKIVFMDQYTGDILWEWVEEGVLASSPAFYKGKVYLYSFDGMVRCISFLEGEELWKTPISELVEFRVPGLRLWPSPTVADGKVYIGSIEGVFYCLDALTGEVLWKYETQGPFRSAPAVVSGKVLVSSTDGSLYCFGIDPQTYRMKAQNYLDNKVYDKAEEFLLKAKEYAQKDEDTEEIENLLDYVTTQMPDYQKRLERLSEAETLMDAADKIIWDKEFKEALTLYTRALIIYEELNDDFGASFCERRIDYIEERIAQQSWIEKYWKLLMVICLGAAVVFFVKISGRKK